MTSAGQFLIYCIQKYSHGRSGSRPHALGCRLGFDGIVLPMPANHVGLGRCGIRLRRAHVLLSRRAFGPTRRYRGTLPVGEGIGSLRSPVCIHFLIST